MSYEDQYGLLDRLLHRIAFRSNTVQHAMSDLERILFRKVLGERVLNDSIFITALPRTGTTILLRLLVGTGQFASHTYQDMPFVLCPMLWRRFSRHFPVDRTSRERAHGDGLKVSGDSPEGFEEVIWKYFWPRHYSDGSIQPWTPSDRDEEFEEFLGEHMRKITLLRRKAGQGELRYLSKNNLNIARLMALPEPLRRGKLLIPFREPLQHAASMLQQHIRFLEIHRTDPFVLRYMEAIGHCEFGQGLRPINFEGWLADAPSPMRLEFWLRYWIAAYRFVLSHDNASLHLMSYARLTEKPGEALTVLAGIVDVKVPALLCQAEDLWPPREHAIDPREIPARLLDEAIELHRELDRRAAV